MRLALMLALVASPAAAQSVADLSGSTVTLRASQEPGAVAEVEFINIDRNGPHDSRGFSLEVGGLPVDFRFTWQANPDGDDGVWIAPPDGYRAEPDYLVVPEGQVGTALIYPLNSVGM